MSWHPWYSPVQPCSPAHPYPSIRQWSWRWYLSRKAQRWSAGSPCLGWWQLHTLSPIRVMTSWWLEVNCELFLSVRSLQPSPTGCSCSPEQLWHKNSAGGRHSCPQLQELGSPEQIRAGDKAPSLSPQKWRPIFPKNPQMEPWLYQCLHFPLHTHSSSAT